MSSASKSVTPAETVPETAPPQTKDDFEVLLGKGRESLVVGDVEDACEQLGEATVLSVKLFGDFAVETFDPFFYYGKALLESVVGDDESIDESEVHDESAAQEGEKQEEVKPADEVEESMEEGSEAPEFDPDQTLKPDEEDDDEDSESVQIALEALSYARVTCEKNSDNSPLWLERQKDTFILLSQASLMRGNSAEAVEDLESALKIADAHFADDVRTASFIHLELARVHRKDKKFSESNSHIEKAISALQQLKAKLEGESKDENSLAEVQDLLEDALDEQKFTQLCESEDKENSEKQPSKSDDKINIIEIKRKSVEQTEKPSGDSIDAVPIKQTEKRPAGDSIDGVVDFKKSKVGDS